MHCFEKICYLCRRMLLDNNNHVMIDMKSVFSMSERAMALLFAALFAFAYAWADDKATFDSAQWNWQMVGKDGAVRGKCSFEDLFGGKQIVSIVKYGEGSLTTSLVYNEGADKALTTSGVATATTATVAINGSYFNISSGSDTYLYTTVPLWYNNTLVNRNTNPTRSTGIIGFTAEGAIGFAPYSEENLTALQSQYASFVTSGPLLRLGNANQELPSVDESFDGVNPRSMMGVTADRTVYMVVVDGRSSAAAGVTVVQLQQMAEWLGLTDAINLDGGGSSALWAAGSGILNTPSDGRERVVPTVIVAKDKSSSSDTTPALVDGYYQIATAADLRWFAQQVNSGYSSLNAQLTADIDLADAPWTPIGTSSATSFTGNFLGQGHSLTGLNIEAASGNTAFIGYYAGKGKICDFAISGTVTYTGNVKDEGVAGVVGHLQSASATVEDIRCAVNINTPNATGNNVRVAGIVAWVNSKASINRCRYSGAISAGANGSQVGGIVGLVTVTAGTAITNCLYDGTITTTAAAPYAAGMVGYANMGSSQFTCSNNLSIGAINASGNNCGAIAGGKGGNSNAASYINNYMGPDMSACGAGWGSAAFTATTFTAQQLSDGTALASIAGLTKNAGGFYPQESSNSNWTQDFAASDSVPTPSASGFTCTHLRTTPDAPCSFCNDGKESPALELHAGDKIEAGGIFYIVNSDLKTLTVTYPGASAPAAAGSNSYAGKIEIPSPVTYGGNELTVTSIGESAFRYSTITSISIPEGVTSIGQYGLRNCEELPTIVFPNSCVSFGRTCVESKALKSVTFGEGAITIGENFGRLCGSNMKDIYFNSTTVPTIGGYFLSSATDVTAHVPKAALDAYAAKFASYANITVIAAGGGDEPTTDLKAGEKIIVEGISYTVNADLKSLTVTYPTAAAPTSGTNTYAGNITIPATLTYGGHELAVTKIGDFAFQYAPITSLSLPEGITHIGQKAIYSTQITELAVPNSVTHTAYESFGYNPKLASITFGENIAANQWGDKLCYNPSGTGVKKDVYMRCKAVPDLQSYTFSFAGAVIHVYPMMVNAFKSSGDWNGFEILGDLLINYTYDDLQSTIKQYAAYVPDAADIGTDPGCTPPSSAEAMTEAIDAARELDSSASLKDINDAINDILLAYEGMTYYPLNEGVYYITNEAKPTTAIYADMSTATTQGLKCTTFVDKDNRYYFRLTRNGANWTMQCLGNDMYVGTAIGGTGNDKKISLTSAPQYAQIITQVKGGLYTIQTTYDGGAASPTLRSSLNVVSTYTYTAQEDKPKAQWRFHPASSDKFPQAFNLENSRVRAFMSEVSYTTQSASKISQYNQAPPARRDQPVPVTVFWQREADTEGQQLILSENQNFASPTVVELSAETASCELYNLIPNRKYYYKVIMTDADGAETEVINSSFVTQGQVRMIKADGVANVRDLGGWPTASGKTIVYGRIFRGAALSAAAMTDDDINSMRALGIRAELDLRSEAETGGMNKSVLGDDVEYKSIPLGQTSTYYAGLTTYKEQYKKDIQYVFECVKNDVPVYFHCAIGADRTGTLAFLLEGVLGVSESDLYRDYELTTLSGQYRTKGYLDSEVITYIKGQNGSSLQDKFYAYFINSLGFTKPEIDAFRKKMLRAKDEAEQPAEGVTRVMTYNIYHCGNGLEAIANAINLQKPHIVALQEVDVMTNRSGRINQMTELARLTGMTSTFCKAITYDGGQYGIGILSREQPLSVRRIELMPDEETRMMLVVEMEDYVFASVHMPLDNQARINSMPIIVNEAAQWGKPFIIAGDFNDAAGNLRTLLRKQFTLHTDTKLPTFGEGTAASCIDYIASYDHIGGVELQNYWVVDDLTTSDHRPAVADLVIDTEITALPSAETATSLSAPLDVYSIDGNLLLRNADASLLLPRLAHGTYIVGGRKVKK